MESIVQLMPSRVGLKPPRSQPHRVDPPTRRKGSLFLVYKYFEKALTWKLPKLKFIRIFICLAKETNRGWSERRRIDCISFSKYQAIKNYLFPLPTR